jgi:hypothetical protein
MLNFLIGFAIGIAVATVGFSGLAKVADKGVSEMQRVVKDKVK